MQNYEVIVVDDVDRLGEIAAIRSEVSLVFIRGRTSSSCPSQRMS
jgi:hypothetical protein